MSINLSEDAIEEVKSEVEELVRRRNEDPLRGNHITSTRIYPKLDTDVTVKYCTRIMDHHCDFLERTSSSNHNGTRFAIIEDKL